MTVDEIIKVVEATGTALNERDYDRYEELHAGSFRYVGPDHPEGLEGAKALTEDLKVWTGAFPDLTVDTELVFGQGEWICVAGSITGTHSGTLPMPDGTALAPTNRRIALRNCSLFKVVDGKVVEQREFFDQGEFAAQLGI